MLEINVSIFLLVLDKYFSYKEPRNDKKHVNSKASIIHNYKPRYLGEDTLIKPKIDKSGHM